MEVLPIDIQSLYNFFKFSCFMVINSCFTFILSSSTFNNTIGISRFQILTAYNYMIWFQYSGNVENDHFNSLSDDSWKCEKCNWNILQYASFAGKSLYRICYFCCQSSVTTTYYYIFQAGKYYLPYLDFSSWLFVILHFVSYLAK